MIRKWLDKLKRFFIKKKEIEKVDYWNIDTSLLYKSRIFNLSYFENTDQFYKASILWEMYRTNSIINNAVNLLVSGILSQDFKVVTDEKGIKEKAKIEDFINSNKFYKMLEDIAKAYIIQGFVCMQIFYTNNVLEYISLPKFELRKDLGLVKIDEKYYSAEHFILIEGESFLLPLIPLHNLIKLTEDSLYANLAKFTFPVIKVITKNKLSEEKQLKIAEKIKNYYENKDLGTMIMFLEENEVDFNIEKVENVLKDYIETLTYLELMVYKNLGILPSLSGEGGGSYAKAKVQENIFKFNIQRITKIVLEEINKKYLPKVLFLLDLDTEARIEVKDLIEETQ